MLSATVPCATAAWHRARTACALVLSLWMGTGSHLLGGGSLPHSWLPLALLVPVATGIGATHRLRLKGPGLFLLLVAGQYAVHCALMLGTAAGPGPSATSTRFHRLHTMAPAGSPGMAEMPGMGHGAWTAVPMSHWMLMMHLAGALATAAALSSVEFVLWLAEVLGRPSPALQPPHVLPARRPERVRGPRRVLPSLLWFGRAPHAVRGPPRLLSV